jgi:hypothetical protein
LNRKEIGSTGESAGPYFFAPEARFSQTYGYTGAGSNVICRSGQRAYIATRMLLQNGFNAKTVSGGMLSLAHNYFLTGGLQLSKLGLGIWIYLL